MATKGEASHWSLATTCVFNSGTTLSSATLQVLQSCSVVDIDIVFAGILVLKLDYIQLLHSTSVPISWMDDTHWHGHRSLCECLSTMVRGGLDLCHITFGLTPPSSVPTEPFTSNFTSVTAYKHIPPKSP